MTPLFKHIPITGLPYHQARDTLEAKVNRKAARLKFVKETTNKHDTDAICVYLAEGTQSLKIGYLPKGLGQKRNITLLKGAAWINLTQQPPIEKGTLWHGELLLEPEWHTHFSMLETITPTHVIKSAANPYIIYNIPLPTLFETPDQATQKPILSNSMTHRKVFVKNK